MTAADQYPLPLPHVERMTAEDFMVTESNQEAAAWIDQWPLWPAHCLIVYGPLGSGKTHLAEVWRDRSHAVLLTRETLLGNDYAQAAIVDNADALMGDKDCEEALFHLFNRLKENGKHLLLTGQTPPALWNINLPDLRSRLVAAQAVALQPLDDSLLIGMLMKQFGDRQLNIEAGVMDYILPRIERSYEAVRLLVEKLDKTSLAANRGITIALVRTVLSQNEAFRLGS